jgi:hypothetical protein
MNRVKSAFGAFVFAEAAHSVEEYAGRLWDSFPPAGYLTGLISSDHELGFIVINTALVAFAIWCLLFPVRRDWRSATRFIWFWIGIGILNGAGHVAWTLRQGAYTPGVATAPLLFGIASYLAFKLNAERSLTR